MQRFLGLLFFPGRFFFPGWMDSCFRNEGKKDVPILAVTVIGQCLIEERCNGPNFLSKMNQKWWSNEMGLGLKTYYYS